jgi:hypothetical protein
LSPEAQRLATRGAHRRKPEGAAAAPTRKVTAWKLGADDYMAKPFNQVRDVNTGHGCAG